jgi:cytosine deaminase
MATLLPPLRIPRALLDPCATHLPVADAEGLLTVQIEQHQGLVTALRPWSGAPGPVPLALTPLVEPHAHIDKAYSASEPGEDGALPAPPGSMAEALVANMREMEGRTAERVRHRARLALDRAWRHGLRAVRSHVDSLGPAADVAWEVLSELRSAWADRLDLQLVALGPLRPGQPPEGAAVAARVAARGGVLGGVVGDPYPSGRADREALRQLLRLAERHGCGVDLHIDESDRRPGQGVALLCAVLAEQSSGVPVTCSHASSLALLPDAACRRLADRLAALEVSVVALPLTNLWLLGRRRAATPCLRPQAPIRQLQEAGVTVAVGGDNVQDPWFPGGDHDPLELLRFSVVASHLLPWQRQGLAPFSTAAARLLGLPWDGVLRPGCPADLLVLGAGSWPELLARPPQRRVLRGGRWLPPPEAEAPSPLLLPLLR